MEFGCVLEVGIRRMRRTIIEILLLLVMVVLGGGIVVGFECIASA